MPFSMNFSPKQWQEFGGNCGKHVHDRLFHRSEHVFTLFDIKSQRFSTEHMFAGLRCAIAISAWESLGVLIPPMSISGDPITARHPLRHFPNRAGTRRFPPLRVASADGMQRDFGGEREKVGSLAPGIGMRFSHEAVANHSRRAMFRHKIMSVE